MVKFTVEAIWSWDFLCWEVFDYWFNHFTHYYALLRFSISPWFSLYRLYFSRNLSILGCKFSCIYYSTVVFYDSLYFCDICCNDPSFTCNCIKFSFFLLIVSKGLFYLHKKWVLFLFLFMCLFMYSFIHSFIHLVAVSFIFTQNLFLPSTNSGLSLLFFKFLEMECLVIWVLSFFLTFISMNILHRTAFRVVYKF